MATTYHSTDNGGSFLDNQGVAQEAAPSVVLEPEEVRPEPVVQEAQTPEPAADLEPEEEENDLIVKLKKPFKFEGQTYTEIDLSGIKNLTGRDMRHAERIFRTMDREGEAGAMIKEKTAGYQMAIAHLATGLPLEFFDRLPISAANDVGNKIFVFFMTE